MNSGPSIRRIERLNYVLGALLVLAALLTQSRAIALGVAVGAALTCANFYVLRRIVAKWSDDVAAGRTRSTAPLILPKFMALMLAVVASILLLPIDAAGFAAGYSLFIVSIVIETVSSAMRGRTPTTIDERDENHG
jgi:hypothetical protein